MFKHFRFLAARLTKLSNPFSRTLRRQIQVPVSVSLEVERQINNSCPNHQALTVSGVTQEIGQNEIAFVVPFIRLGDYHLAGHGGEQKRLKLVLEMPNGRVRATVVTKHYQMVEIHSSVQNYLIGTEIISIYKGDVERYADFLRHGERAAARARQSADAPDLASPKKERSLLSHFSIF